MKTVLAAHTRGTDPLVRFYSGPDHMRREGWVLWLLILPARRLMTRADEGCPLLAGFTLEVRVRWPWGARFYVTDGERNGWRSPIGIRAWSDATEIATRLAVTA